MYRYISALPVPEHESHASVQANSRPLNCRHYSMSQKPHLAVPREPRVHKIDSSKAISRSYRFTKQTSPIPSSHARLSAHHLQARFHMPMLLHTCFAKLTANRNSHQAKATPTGKKASHVKGECIVSLEGNTAMPPHPRCAGLPKRSAPGVPSRPSPSQATSPDSLQPARRIASKPTNQGKKNVSRPGCRADHLVVRRQVVQVSRPCDSHCR